MLEVRGISKNFGGVKALSDVSLSVDEGRIISVIGPNGAGKTTLFNVISGIYPFDNGEILFRGTSLKSVPQHQIARMGLGRTFQNIRLFHGLTVKENLLTSRDPVARYGIFSAAANLPRKRQIDRENSQQCQRYLEMVGLEQYAQEHPENLAYGLQRRVELARALAMEPKLLLLDEPAAGLNPTEVADFIKLIARIRDSLGISLLIIEHRMRVVNELSEYIYVLNFGTVLAAGTPEIVRKDRRVIEAYIGEGGKHAKS